MKIFLRRRRKIHPCLFFQRKTSNSPSTAQPDGTELNKNNVAIIEEVRMAVFLAQGDLPRMSKKRKRDSPEELAVRKKSIEHTLRQRRNGICNEIERSLFQQGAYLEKHRHNLQVTHQLTERGLMWWCVETLVRFRFYSFGLFKPSPSIQNTLVQNSLITIWIFSKGRGNFEWLFGNGTDSRPEAELIAGIGN